MIVIQILTIMLLIALGIKLGVYIETIKKSITEYIESDQWGSWVDLPELNSKYRLTKGTYYDKHKNNTKGRI